VTASVARFEPMPRPRGDGATTMWSIHSPKIPYRLRLGLTINKSPLQGAGGSVSCDAVICCDLPEAPAPLASHIEAARRPTAIP